VAYQEDKDMTYQQVVDNQPAKFELLLPGHPKPESYTLTHLSPYRLHQRCAEKFRVGRICLAADAAHLCNPWGGLGLTGGFADVSGLSECLLGIATGKADHSILDKYDEVRRGIYNSIINPVSTTNLQRVSMSDPDKALEDPVLAKLATASTDPKVRGELEKVSLIPIINLSCLINSSQGAYALCYDFTQHYNSKM
jgi:2-polyprenyl-6-methoxyphenol hydroxylase-like FAD-dependent oxidoreductase